MWHDAVLIQNAFNNEREVQSGKLKVNYKFFELTPKMVVFVFNFFCLKIHFKIESGDLGIFILIQTFYGAATFCRADTSSTGRFDNCSFQ